MTHIRPCIKSCTHPGQDSLHGPGRRVHNEMANGTLRCTVCCTENSQGAANRRVGKSKGK